jgi:drug/metabolite transporter (DMT)-like permease
MGAKTVIGIVLIILGIVSLGYQGFTYTTRKKVVDIGPIQATKKENHTVPLPPILGVIALAGGVVVLAAGRRGE